MNSGPQSLVWSQLHSKWSEESSKISISNKSTECTLKWLLNYKNVNCKNTVITGVIVVVNCNTWKCLSCKRRNNSWKDGYMYTIRENMIYFISVKEVSFLSNVFWFINAKIIPIPSLWCPERISQKNRSQPLIPIKHYNMDDLIFRIQ